MNQTLSDFLDAHVQYELRRFSGKGLARQVDQEVDAAFLWMSRLKLSDVSNPLVIIDTIRREVVDLPIAGGITELAGEMSRRVLSSKANADSTLEDIFPRRIFYDLADKAAGMEKARKQKIYRALHTSMYFGLLAEAIVAAAKHFILESNIVVRRVPLVSFLLETGREIYGKAFPRWLEGLSGHIQEELGEKIEAAVLQNQDFFVEFLDENRLTAVSDEIWKNISGKSLEEHFATVDPEDLEDFIVTGYEFWLHFRKTRYFEMIYTELVQYFFEKYGDLELDVLLEDMGVDRELVRTQLIETLAPVVRTALKTGYLEERLRARLLPFYKSRKATAILAQAKKKTA